MNDLNEEYPNKEAAYNAGFRHGQESLRDRLDEFTGDEEDFTLADDDPIYDAGYSAGYADGYEESGGDEVRDPERYQKLEQEVAELKRELLLAHLHIKDAVREETAFLQAKIRRLEGNPAASQLDRARSHGC